MNKRIKKKRFNSNAIKFKSYHTERQIAYKTNNYLRKLGMKLYGVTKGVWKGPESQVQSFPRDKNDLFIL